MVRGEDGKRTTLPSDSLAVKGMQLAYSATSHDFQGSTVDNVILAMDSREQLATQKSFYVGLSRMRHETTLVTDDAERLQRTIQSKTGERINALEALEKSTAERARSEAQEEAAKAAEERVQKEQPTEAQKDRVLAPETGPKSNDKSKGKETEKASEKDAPEVNEKGLTKQEQFEADQAKLERGVERLERQHEQRTR